jgi:hypothetical protein
MKLGLPIEYKYCQIFFMLTQLVMMFKKIALENFYKNIKLKSF